MLTILLPGNVVVAQAEVDQLEALVGGVDQDVEGLDVAMHDSAGVDVMQGLG